MPMTQERRERKTEPTGAGWQEPKERRTQGGDFCLTPEAHASEEGKSQS